MRDDQSPDTRHRQHLRRRTTHATHTSDQHRRALQSQLLLARQHAQNFRQRFAGLPVNVGQLSRMVGAAETREVKKGLAEGGIDIVVGTHAVLGKTVSFKDLGLVVVDEEQHFGVAHKERLKELRSEVHVLTLSATPIPRTLQLAMTGVREMSIIATPPIDRLAVRTFVSIWTSGDWRTGAVSSRSFVQTRIP